MNVGARRIPDPLLEYYLVGSLDAEARAEVEVVLAQSEADQARLAELRTEAEAFLVQHPPGPLVERFNATLQVPRMGARRIPDPLLECYLVGSLDAEARAEVEVVAGTVGCGPEPVGGIAGRGGGIPGAVPTRAAG